MKQFKNSLILVIAILMIVNFQSFSQKDTLKNSDTDYEFGLYEEETIEIQEVTEEEDDKIYLAVKKMPEFPGGVNALRRYIAENLEWPIQACDIWGTVYIRFEVRKTGEIGKVEVQRGIDPLLDQEAVRVIKSLPNFIPGEQNGKKVNVWYSIPVTFKIN